MRKIHTILLISLLLSVYMFSTAANSLHSPDPQPPDEPVKLIFIHHSCGENWLTDGYGNLGKQLGQNNYFVSDTNYGWGPDAIGDRTDIPDWLEWFRSDRTEEITQTLYDENGQLSNYSRSLADPGGENTIIMFKSCFPNSELSGSPDDPPGTFADLSVSGAKYVYNQLLQYFATRPDKLFIVVTAPPVSSRANAKNARAFNNWLVEDWLSGNDYLLENVAVFDFYNILTGKDAHHRYNNDQIEHITSTSNTLYYPSGDDHPSEIGSQKATEEFIPLLNYYYQRWKASASSQMPAAVQQEEPTPISSAAHADNSPESSATGTTMAAAAMIDDFESDNPLSANGWELFSGNPANTSMDCTVEEGSAYEGARALMVNLDVKADDWATCSILFDQAQDWSASEGFTFMLHALEIGSVFDVNLYTGSDDALQTYTYSIETTTESMEGWISVTLRWEDLHRVEWEENANSPFNPSNLVIGFAFGVNADNSVAISIDNLALADDNSTTDQP